MGFYAHVGPLEVFVSKQLIPGDYKFDPVGQVPFPEDPIACRVLEVPHGLWSKYSAHREYPEYLRSITPIALPLLFLYPY